LRRAVEAAVATGDTHEVDGAGELRPDACTQFLRRALLDLVTGERSRSSSRGIASEPDRGLTKMQPAMHPHYPHA